MSILDRVRGAGLVRSQAIMAGFTGGLDAGSFTFNGVDHQLNTSLAGSPAVSVGPGFEDRVANVHEQSGPVSAAIVARSLPMTQMRFKWRNESGDRPGRLFGNETLAPFERPGSMTRPQWLALCERHASLGGNSYTRLTAAGTLHQLRPDWVDIVLGSDELPESASFAADATKVGFIYWPGGRDNEGVQPELYTSAEVIHWAPEPHPLWPWLGESWVTAILRDIAADGQATDHIQKFFANAATSNMVVKAAEGLSEAQFSKWRDLFESKYQGSANAWRNIYLSHGTDVQVVGSSLGDLRMGDLQGGFETRIAVRSRVPSTMLGTREGLGGSALNAGNYDSARRLWADGFLVPHMESFCAAAEMVLQRPAGPVELTFDPRRVMILQEDRTQAADILQSQASIIETLHRAGFEPDAAVSAAVDGDLAGLLGSHTGLSSVQLIAPGSGEDGATVSEFEPANDFEAVERMALTIQKVYLGVGKVVTVDEARMLVNAAAAGERVQLTAGNPIEVSP